ncbi:cation-translocating P-type ATPase [Massilia sp. RP-1-19]|uniref:Cation-translocating P-type ATPase n=1 Tax=Massilia polaris TaxID=2728846 RepID=A0A848HGD8_9BURK|nr:cation-translocating P-type ATPase [Massilia polaris]NML60946.1 cation-translocating P-type ATPase [Massilia polaris]
MASIPGHTGLSSSEAAERLQRSGPNALPGGARRTWRHIALDAAREPMFLLLVGGGLLYLVLGDLLEGAFLFAMVLVTIGMTLYQEGKTERALDALRDLGSPRALVLRDGAPVHIDSRGVVPGDVLVLSEGDRVPADGVLFEGAEVQADESLLTGESAAVSKRPGTAPDPLPRPGGDDTPLLYSGTLLVHGHGLVLVTATGAAAEIGRIGQALAQIAPERSPLQKQTARLVAIFAAVGAAMSLLLVLLYGLRSGDWLESLLAGIALAMSMLPEEFPVVLTVFPALGAWRLARANVLTRRLAAIETLGATSVLCVDKTGTLTENRMRVHSLFADGVVHALDGAPLPGHLHELARRAVLASAAAPFDPMEKALHELAVAPIPGLALAREYPLSPALRAMTQAWRQPGQAGYIVAAKGAPEAILSLCALDGAAADAVRAATDQMALGGLRVLGVASADWAGELPAAQHGFAFSFVGLVALADPLRADIPDAVAACRAAGVRIVMITGDYPATAAAIAAQAGIDTGKVVSGDTLDGMDDGQLREHLRGAGVCARIAPDQKLRIVQALKEGGAIVGMTGDGVNDAPALRAAHVGIAMGKRGTDVAREAAALVLLDDRFSSIVQAVRLGRQIFQNMQKSMSYILGVHVTVAGMALVPVLLGWPVLLYPMHIVFLELMIDPACALAFENEPAEARIMTTPPRDPKAPLFGGWTVTWAALVGLGSLVAVLAAYGWAVRHMPEDQARAFGFAALVAANIAQIFANRSHTRSMLQGLQTTNRLVWIVAGVALAMLLVSIYQPLLAGLFRFTAPAPGDLAAAVGIGLASIVWFEALKLLRKPHTGAAAAG